MRYVPAAGRSSRHLSAVEVLEQKMIPAKRGSAEALRSRLSEPSVSTQPKVAPARVVG